LFEIVITRNKPQKLVLWFCVVAEGVGLSNGTESIREHVPNMIKTTRTIRTHARSHRISNGITLESVMFCSVLFCFVEDSLLGRSSNGMLFLGNDGMIGSDRIKSQAVLKRYIFARRNTQRGISGKITLSDRGAVVALHGVRHRSHFLEKAKRPFRINYVFHRIDPSVVVVNCFCVGSCCCCCGTNLLRKRFWFFTESRIRLPKS